MTPENPTPDSVEYIDTHRSSTFAQYLPAPQVYDLLPGDTSTGVSDTWNGTAGGPGASLEVRIHFLQAREMHGIDLTFSNTENSAMYAIEGSLDALNYDVLVPPQTLAGTGLHHVRGNFDFPAKPYNFYAISVLSQGADASSTVTCTDCRLYSFFLPDVSLTGSITVPSGQQVNLAYTVGLAGSAFIDNGVGVIAANSSGNVVVSPSVTTTYTLTATNKYGASLSSVTVTIASLSAPLASLSSSKSQIAPGEGSVLSYSSTNANTVTLTPETGSVITTSTGQVTVHPASTTTYVLAASGLGGHVTAQTTVSVVNSAVIGCMDIAALNYNPNATKDTSPSSCTYAANLPVPTARGVLRRPVAITISAAIVLPVLRTDFSSPPSVSISLTASQKSALGLTGTATVTSLQGLAFCSGAKLHIPLVDVTKFDPAACAARAAVRLDDDGTLTFFLVPGPLSAAGEVRPELYPSNPTLTPYLVAGTWHVWALLVLSSYTW